MLFMGFSIFLFYFPLMEKEKKGCQVVCTSLSQKVKTVKHEYPLLQLSLPFVTTHQTEANHF